MIAECGGPRAPAQVAWPENRRLIESARSWRIMGMWWRYCQAVGCSAESISGDEARLGEIRKNLRAAQQAGFRPRNALEAVDLELDWHAPLPAPPPGGHAGTRERIEELARRIQAGLDLWGEVEGRS